MKFIAYLSFDGRCREAFEFYAKTLGGKIVAMISHGETGYAAQVPAEWQDKIINAHLTVGEAELMGADAPPQYFKGVEGVSVSIQVESETEAERIFNAFADGGTITLPFAPTFWAKGFGMVKDKFGTPWMIGGGAVTG
jgi:PhnB protein